MNITGYVLGLLVIENLTATLWIESTPPASGWVWDTNDNIRQAYAIVYISSSHNSQST
jgi:hypothetical protein